MNEHLAGFPSEVAGLGFALDVIETIGENVKKSMVFEMLTDDLDYAQRIVEAASAMESVRSAKLQTPVGQPLALEDQHKYAVSVELNQVDNEDAYQIMYQLYLLK